jgi:hypothetical protein
MRGGWRLLAFERPILTRLVNYFPHKQSGPCLPKQPLWRSWVGAYRSAAICTNTVKPVRIDVAI